MSDASCRRCNGTGSYLMEGDLHRSTGWVPCDCSRYREPEYVPVVTPRQTVASKKKPLNANQSYFKSLAEMKVVYQRSNAGITIKEEPKKEDEVLITWELPPTKEEKIEKLAQFLYENHSSKETVQMWPWSVLVKNDTPSVDILEKIVKTYRKEAKKIIKDFLK